MSSGNQKFILIGRLGKDAKLENIEGGKKVLNFSVAVTENWKDKTTGEKKEHTEWFDCSAWGDYTNLVPYLTKGSQVYLEGKLRSGSYEKDVKGEKVTIPTLKVKVDEINLLISTKEKAEAA